MYSSRTGVAPSAPLRNPDGSSTAAGGDPTLSVEVTGLNFDFGGPKILENVNLKLPYGARCLLVGANGAGKSTVLRILAGKRLVKEGVNVLGKSAFYDSPPGITYLGTEWAANPIVRRDVPVSRLLKSQGAERYPERCARLLDIMDVNVNWHMHEVSDGQRRRVQIILGLLEPWNLLLLDEVTTDLDVLVRRDLLQFLREDTESRQASIIYATHIFDGLGTWPSHVAHIHQGTITLVREVDVDFPELEEAKKESLVTGSSPLLAVVEKWLRKDFEERVKARGVRFDENGKAMTKWDMLSENMKEYGDKFYNYWN